MTTFIKVNPTKNARERVNKALEVLPKRWRGIFFFKYPEYDTPEGRLFLTRVASGNTADLRVTEILEQIAEEYKQKQTV